MAGLLEFPVAVVMTVICGPTEKADDRKGGQYEMPKPHQERDQNDVFN